MDESTDKLRLNKLTLGLGGLALILALFTMFQSYSNRGLQAQVIEDQAKLTKSQALANLNNSLVQIMAKAAVDNDDSALRRLLANNGVTINANAPAPKADGDDNGSQ